MKITLNKENWSGEEITIIINEAERSFKFYDHDVHIVPTIDFDFYKKEFDMECYDLMIENEKVGWVGKELAEKNWMSMDGDIHREDEIIYVAAAKLLSNIL